MAKSIVARRKGDEYQARFFWMKLLSLRTSDHVESVIFESEEVSFVDDIVVKYSYPILNELSGSHSVLCDLYQCKYHMVGNGAFTSQNLINPRFINSRLSMLERLYDAYTRLKEIHNVGTFRLIIVSNWHWDHRDVIAQYLHEGMIRPGFFERTHKNQVSSVLSEFAEHLSVSHEVLRSFLNSVRFELGKNLLELTRNLDPLLKLAGIQPINPTASSIIYDDLAWKLFQQGRHTFTKEQFDVILHEEGLIVPSNVEQPEISIKSFSKYVRRPHDLQISHLDLCNLFDGRMPKNQSYWNKEIPHRVSKFLFDEPLLQRSYPILLFFDCHLSIAFIAGNLISPKHRIEIIPTQMDGYKYSPWSKTPPDFSNPVWEHEIKGEITAEVVLVISVTHKVDSQVQSYLESELVCGLPIITVQPNGGPGPYAVTDGEHAWNLGFQLADFLSSILPRQCCKLHLYYAGPVALSYIFGHTLRNLTQEIQLYEYDLEGQMGKQSYSPSIRI